MSYKCTDCGHIFEEGEEARWLEDYGECWGVPARKEETGCPICHGYYEETVQCKICGAECLDEDLCGGVCAECIDEHNNDIDVCLKIGSADTTDVPLNCFLAAVFSPEDINDILTDVLMRAKQYGGIDCTEFINADREWFAEGLCEEVNKP